MVCMSYSDPIKHLEFQKEKRERVLVLCSDVAGYHLNVYFIW